MCKRFVTSRELLRRSAIPQRTAAMQLAGNSPARGSLLLRQGPGSPHIKHAPLLKDVTSLRLRAISGSSSGSSHPSMRCCSDQQQPKRAAVRIRKLVAQPVQQDASAASDSAWVRDPQSGERRKVRLSKYRTLMLDSSYRPIAVVNWQRAVRIL
jgi:hypothetical protein